MFKIMVNPISNALVTPPDEKIENGIVSAIVIDLSDIRTTKDGFLDLGITDGVVTRIPIKRRGTYHGKRYDRPIRKFTYK